MKKLLAIAVILALFLAYQACYLPLNIGGTNGNF